MDVKRRKFLKIAGLSAVAGVGAPSAFNMLLKGDVYASSGGGHSEPTEDKGHGKEAGPKGKQYGLVIDIKKFTNTPGLAEKCIDACHTVHNVPDYGNPKDEIKWLWEDDYEHSFPEHSQHHKNKALQEMQIMLLCNHCAQPPCVRACPTKATFKNADGIVMMDYHRCIGCRFCMAACPYGARSFNWRNPREQYANGNYKFFKKGIDPAFPTRMRGVVEKCNFCVKRLSQGKLPACVEATGNTGAMTFGDINNPNSEISTVLSNNFTIQRKPATGTYPSVFYII
jgi:molybdopterin-containing oxidoreductase family iron-sulfur binding subunit